MRILFCCVMLLLLSGCGERESVVAPPDSRPAKLFTVSVGEGQFERHFPARAEAGDKATLTFRVPGELQHIDVLSGTKVGKGQLLANLNPDEYQVLVDKAEAQYRLASVQFQRLVKLRKSRVISEQDYDEGQAVLNSAKANRNQAQANLDYTRLMAPYEGTISYIALDEFQYVAAKQGVMNIQSNRLLKVIFQLPEALLNRFATDEHQATMVFDAFPKMQFPLRFQEVDTEADPKTGTYKITFVMERPDDVGILPGMLGQVHVVGAHNKPTPLPQAAIISDGSGTAVWRVNSDSKAERAQVELNAQGEVVSGLNDGEQIIVSGVDQIEAGMTIREWVKEAGL